MQTITPVLIGVTILFAGAVIGATAMTAREKRGGFVYAQLVLMVGVYVGFAITRLDAATVITRGDWTALLVESVLALGFVFAGLVALRSERPWTLGALILSHGVVDLLHLSFDASHSPAWYAFICLIYDALVGAAAVWLLSDDKNRAEPL